MLITLISLSYFIKTGKEEDLWCSLVFATAVLEILIYYTILCYSCNLIYGVLAGLLFAGQISVAYLLYDKKRTDKTKRVFEKTIPLLCALGLIEFVFAILFIVKASVLSAASFALMVVLFAIMIVALERAYEYYKNNAKSIPKEVLSKKLMRKILCALIIGLGGFVQYLIICGVV
ncbi:hypothetical protein D6774_02305 [Candidatus Woesearchaeota archaeon]|nr:MAG: hypothetical protein D6774_02305 [Candidatus Woesearchaeota archaeon]